MNKKNFYIIVLVLAIMIIFVEPNKANINLSLSNIVNNVANNHYDIESLIQKTNIYYKEETLNENPKPEEILMLEKGFFKKLVPDDRDVYKSSYSRGENLRLEAFYKDINLGSDDFYLTVSNYEVIYPMETKDGYLYRYKNDKAYKANQVEKFFSELDLDPEEKKESDFMPTIPYYTAWKEELPIEIFEYKDGLKFLIENKELLEVKKAEQYYILTFTSKNGSDIHKKELQDIKNFILKHEPDMINYFDSEADEVIINLRFLVDFSNLYLQNVHISYRQIIGKEKRTFAFNTIFEQFNIVEPPKQPNTAAPFPQGVNDEEKI